MISFDDIIKEELSINHGCSPLLKPHYFNAPIELGEIKMKEIEQKHSLINKFFSIVAYLGKKTLEDSEIDLSKVLFSEAPLGLNGAYHKSLPDCCWTPPFLYRTDESLSGKIFEIQSPGSGWGDLHLLAKCYDALGYCVPDYLLNFPNIYSAEIKKYTHCSFPRVFHMLDAASVPYNMRYLLSITNELAYWGIDGSVKMHDVDFVISHSVTSLIASNFFNTYLDKARNNELVFSTQPNIIFDEKAIYLLPFFRESRQYFSKEIRELFPFTTFIENNGYFDENDDFVSIDEFVKRPPRERRYYLKYGGPDTNRNWGSRSVYRLSGSDCKKLLDIAVEKAKHGEVWLIQEDCSKCITEDFSSDITDILSKRLNIKISSFYGRDILFGVKIMARNHFKVHGQNDTFTGIGV